MLIIVRIVEFLDQITTYIMTTIPKLFSTLDVINYGYWPMGPPEEPGEEPEEEPEDNEPDEEPEKKCAALGSAQENWQVVEETKKPAKVVRFVRWVFRRNS